MADKAPLNIGFSAWSTRRPTAKSPDTHIVFVDNGDWKMLCSGRPATRDRTATVAQVRCSKCRAKVRAT